MTTLTLNDSPEGSPADYYAAEASGSGDVGAGSTSIATSYSSENKQEDPTTLFGIWKDQPRTLSEIRWRD